MHYANPGVLASVLQEKSEVYFICWYAKLLFFPCLFTESSTAILAIKYLCVTGSKRGKRLCSEVLKMRLIFSNWLICYEHTKALQIDMVNLEKRIWWIRRFLILIFWLLCAWERFVFCECKHSWQQDLRDRLVVIVSCHGHPGQCSCLLFFLWKWRDLVLIWVSLWDGLGTVSEHTAGLGLEGLKVGFDFVCYSTKE